METDMSMPYITFPMVSNLAPPTGHLFVSNRAALRCSQKSRTLAPMSKTASIALARRDRDADDIAA